MGGISALRRPEFADHSTRSADENDRGTRKKGGLAGRAEVASTPETVAVSDNSCLRARFNRARDVSFAQSFENFKGT